MQKRLGNKGLTLVEIITSLAILAIIVTPLSTMFVTAVKNNALAEERLIANQMAQSKMEEWMHKDLIAEVNEDEDIVGDYTIVTTINKYSDGVATSTGTVISDYDIDVTASDFPDHVTMEVKESNVLITSEGIEIEEKAYEEDTTVQIKLHCDVAGKTIDVFNYTDKEVKIYKVYSSNKFENTIQTLYGKVYVYDNIYDSSAEEPDKYKAYTITIVVKKGTKELTRLVSLKTID